MARLITAIGILLIVPLFGTVQAQTLVDTIEIPKRSPVTTGVAITSPTQADDTVPERQETSSDKSPSGLSYTEYQVGSSTVREYRSGDRLMYVEITQKSGSSYVIDYSAPQKSDQTQYRSGVIVSRW
jgi:hypothetical protein